MEWPECLEIAQKALKRFSNLASARDNYQG